MVDETNFLMASTLKRNSPEKSVGDRAMSGLGNLIKLLPSATVFIYQFLNPVLTNNGHCHVINKYLSGILITLCGFSCCFSSFTDSYTDSDGVTRYGIVTCKGLWTISGGIVDLPGYGLQIADFVHAFFSLIVFAALSLLDNNTVMCFYPSFVATEKVLVLALPPAIGALSSAVFMLFPNHRHGIGYPSSPDPSKES